MLNRIDVVEPPNSAPQYMLVSRMMAETGSMVKVSGRSSETPFGAPSPGRTPTRTPSRTPTIMRATWYVVRATPKPCMSDAKLSTACLRSICWSSVKAQRCFERPFQERHLKRDFQHDIEENGGRDAGQDRHHEAIAPL